MTLFRLSKVETTSTLAFGNCSRDFFRNSLKRPLSVHWRLSGWSVYVKWSAKPSTNSVIFHLPRAARMDLRMSLCPFASVRDVSESMRLVFMNVLLNLVGWVSLRFLISVVLFTVLDSSSATHHLPFHFQIRPIPCLLRCDAFSA